MRVVTQGSACCTLSQYTFHGRPIGCAASPSPQTKSNSPGFMTDHESFYVVTFTLTRSLFLCVPHSLPHSLPHQVTRQGTMQSTRQMNESWTVATAESVVSFPTDIHWSDRQQHGQMEFEFSRRPTLALSLYVSCNIGIDSMM